MKSEDSERIWEPSGDERRNCAFDTVVSVVLVLTPSLSTLLINLQVDLVHTRYKICTYK